MVAPEQNPNSIPEEVQLGMRLEGILCPHIRQRREEIRGSREKARAGQSGETQFRCAHYTSAEAALKIISSKRLWMRNTTCMSDYREVQHGFGIVRSYFSDAKRRDAFHAALDVCHPGAGPEAVKLFDQLWQNIQLATYIASVSEHDFTEDVNGRLSMWRAFGRDIARVAMVFNIPEHSAGARALNVVFNPVMYLTEGQVHTEIDRASTNVRTNQEFLRGLNRDIVVWNVFNMLLANVICSKHEGFKEEREWRAIYFPYRMPSQLMESSTEIVSGIPQIIFKIPLDGKDPVLQDLDFPLLFDRLIIGPSPYPVVMYGAFVDALFKAGVLDAPKRVLISNIPIRTA